MVASLFLRRSDHPDDLRRHLPPIPALCVGGLFLTLSSVLRAGWLLTTSNRTLIIKADNMFLKLLYSWKTSKHCKTQCVDFLWLPSTP